MGEVVNLKRTRKAKARDEREKLATENRARFGRTKEDRVKAEREAGKAVKDLDGKRLD